MVAAGGVTVSSLLLFVLSVAAVTSLLPARPARGCPRCAAAERVSPGRSPAASRGSGTTRGGLHREQDHRGDQQQRLEHRRALRGTAAASRRASRPLRTRCPDRKHPQHDAGPVAALPGEPDEQSVDDDEDDADADADLGAELGSPCGRASTFGSVSIPASANARSTIGLPVEQGDHLSDSAERHRAQEGAETGADGQRPLHVLRHTRRSPWAPTAPARSRGTAGPGGGGAFQPCGGPYGPPGWFSPCPDVISEPSDDLRPTPRPRASRA